VSKRKLGHVQYAGKIEHFIEESETVPNVIEMSELKFISKQEEK